ncbi:MAG TPA: DUF5723 family protein [Longimicrobiales bacterium]|nr:DUF5723 family protein [Longimicrobiales bacterium]
MTKHISIRSSLAGAFIATFAAQAAAQLPSASTRALGMGDNFTAVARGFASVSWNPAMLGMPGNPGASLTLLPLRGVAGLGPVKLADIADYSDKFVPASQRESWLQAIETEGSEQGNAGADVTFIAAQIGRLGVQAGTVVRAVSNLSPGAAELLFFGNAGRTGQPRSFNLAGSRIQSHAVSTVGLSYAIPFGKSDAPRQSSFGITAKYTIGHALLLGQDEGSTVTADPSLSVKFPLVSTSEDDFNGFNVNGGNGVGVDVGFATRSGKVTIAAAVKNVVNTFKWDETHLRFRPGTATFDQNNKTSQFDEQAFTTAPANLRQMVEDAKYKPVIAAGVGLEVSPKLTVSADARMRAGDTTIEEEPKMHIGAGAEFRVVPLLPIRVGAAIVTGGYQIGAGVGLNLGPLNLGLSVASRKGDLGTDVVTMVTLVSTTGR